MRAIKKNAKTYESPTKQDDVRLGLHSTRGTLPLLTRPRMATFALNGRALVALYSIAASPPRGLPRRRPSGAVTVRKASFSSIACTTCAANAPRPADALLLAIEHYGCLSTASTVDVILLQPSRDLVPDEDTRLHDVRGVRGLGRVCPEMVRRACQSDHTRRQDERRIKGGGKQGERRIKDCFVIVLISPPVAWSTRRKVHPQILLSPYVIPQTGDSITNRAQALSHSLSILRRQIV